MHGCTYTPMHARMHACTPARIHTYTHAHMNARMYARTHACTHARFHAYTHANMHACTHARMHACRRARMHERNEITSAISFDRFHEEFCIVTNMTPTSNKLGFEIIMNRRVRKESNTDMESLFFQNVGGHCDFLCCDVFTSGNRRNVTF